MGINNSKEDDENNTGSKQSNNIPTTKDNIPRGENNVIKVENDVVNREDDIAKHGNDKKDNEVTKELESDDFINLSLRSKKKQGPCSRKKRKKLRANLVMVKKMLNLNSVRNNK